MVLITKFTDKIKSWLKYCADLIIEILLLGGFGFLLGAIIDNYLLNHPAGEYAIALAISGIIIAIAHRNWKFIEKHLKTIFPFLFIGPKTNQKSDDTGKIQTQGGPVPYENGHLPEKVEETVSSTTTDSHDDKYIPSTEDSAIFSHFEEEFGIVSRSKCMLDVFRKINIFAPSEIGILILGDTGTGKTLLANVIHNASRRSGKFIKVDCSKIPETLIESELFGVVANHPGFDHNPEKIGKFKQADEGTICLDEIGDAPDNVQEKIREVIDEKVVQQIGGEYEEINIRVICATNVDLKKRIAEGFFLQDLYNRIAVKTITMPPLSERNADIPLIAMHLFNHQCEKENISFDFAVKTEHFADLLSVHNFTDIRILRNFMHGLVIELNSLPDPGIHTLMELISPQTKGSSNVKDDNYPMHLVEYISNDFNKINTCRALNGIETRTLRKEMNTELLIIGKQFEYKVIEIADYLIRCKSLQKKPDQEILLKEINDRLKEIIEYCQTPQDERSKKRAYAPECEQLAVKLTKIRSDLM